MDPALWKLLQLWLKGTVRRVLRWGTRGKGILAIVVGGAVLVLWLLPALLVAISSLVSGEREPLPGFVQLGAYVVLVVCAMPLLSNTASAIALKPAEVDFLLAGPFTRRQLLVYKLIRSSLGAALVAVIFAIWLTPYTGGFGTGFVGIFLIIMLSHTVGMAAAYARAAAARAVYTTLRRLAAGVIIALILAMIFTAAAPGFQASIEAAREQLDPLLPLRWFRESLVGTVLLAPFDVYIRVATAGSVPALLGWGVLAAGMNLGMFALVLRLDRAAPEAVLDASRQAQLQMRRVSRGKWLTARSSRGAVPRLSRWGPTGATLWRQLTTAVRTFLRTYLILAAIIVGVGVILALRADEDIGGFILAMGAIYLTFFATMALRFDFRGDLDNMEQLKTLPIPPGMLALAQLATPAVMMAGLQLALLAVAVPVVDLSPALAVALAAAALPVNILLFSVENLFFLLYPMRMAGSNPMDLHRMGRGALVGLAKLIVLGICGALVAGIAAAAYFLSFRTPAAGFIAGLATLCTLCIPMIALVGWAFQRFDVSRDMPA